MFWNTNDFGPIPRDETPSGSTGGKRVYLDKVIWRYIPDPFDAAEDLAAGKVDWWEDPPLDFIPKDRTEPGSPDVSRRSPRGSARRFAATQNDIE